MVSQGSAAATLLGSVLVLALAGCASANFGSWQTGRATFYGEQQRADQNNFAAAGPAIRPGLLFLASPVFG